MPRRSRLDHYPSESFIEQFDPIRRVAGGLPAIFSLEAMRQKDNFFDFHCGSVTVSCRRKLAYLIPCGLSLGS